MINKLINGVFLTFNHLMKGMKEHALESVFKKCLKSCSLIHFSSAHPPIQLSDEPKVKDIEDWNLEPLNIFL